MNLLVAIILTTSGAIVSTIILGITFFVIRDIYRYRDLQKRIKREQTRKQENAQTRIRLRIIQAEEDEK